MTSTLAAVGFFDEAPGVRSSMRLMAVMSLLAGIASGLLTVMGRGSGDGVLITTMFLSAAFGGKLVQKGIEAKPLPTAVGS